ncbi:MAG: class I SAM-dependent methyltransferase [Lachnospiraceae bacterium]|nr:class I SAM-dependent methyltransferase [Lachnospiraceae bacterium]
MWIADRWNDYEVLDTTKGEKLERWGDYILVRPDPQVIWDTGYSHEGWKRKNGHYHRSAKGGGSWETRDLPEEWTITYDGISRPMVFHLKPFAFKHTGVFPEQAVNWDWCGERIQKFTAGTGRELGRDMRVLNLFAYTGGATVSAALSGAFVTHVDAAKGMVGWARENAASSGVPSDRIRWLVDDCMKFVEREGRRGNTYDGIIMDPPSYGRGPKGEIWKIEECVYPLIKAAAGLLSKEADFFLINSYTTGLQPAVLSYMLGECIAAKRGGKVQADEIGLPVQRNGLILPCGASGRWMLD